MASRERHHRRPSRLPPPPGTEPTWRTEGAPESGEPAHRRHWLKPSRLLWVIAAAVVGNLLIVSLLSDGQGRVEVAYSVFAAQVEADNVAVVTSTGDAISGEFRAAIVDPEDAADAEPSVVSFTTQRPAFADDDLIAVLVANGVEVRAEPESTGTSWFLALLVNLGPALLLIGGYVWLMRRAGGLGGLGTLGRSRAVRSDTSGRRTTFADVAGIDEATEELVEVVDFLRNPDRYRSIGARAPRGVLLMGPPGTGKTLLARAVAGEANVPFFSMSASEFIEMIVGVGASRVRDLFDKAKAVAPSIIFIDELDAIGRARGSVASFGGVDEREQTLNQILTEMDGFTGNEGVIVLAATNRPDVLDPALLRPGRFDRRVVLNPPDQKGRAAILRVHTRKVPLSVDTDLEVIASTTPGMVGADLANLVNEAALMAARRQHEVVTPSDFADALERIVLGAERRIMLSDEERRRTAYHEAGHALLAMLEQGADPVRKVSIIPRGRSLGVTFQSPASDRYGMSEVYLRGRIVGALGGRAAEEVVFGDTTTGAESDLEQVTAIARQMVGRWGMSAAVGPITVLPAPGADVGFGLMDPSAPAEATRQLVDAEVRAIVDECYGRAVELVRSNRERLDKVAAALLARETLDEAEVYAAAGVAPPPHS